MDTSEAEILMLAANDVLAEYTNNTHHPVPIWGRQQAALLFNTEWLWKQGGGGAGSIRAGGDMITFKYADVPVPGSVLHLFTMGRGESDAWKHKPG